MVAYATSQDVEDRWRPLSDSERARAEVLVNDASIHLRSKYPTLDARIASTALDPEAAAMVVAGMVRRAMLAGGGGEAVTQQAQTAGPFGLSQTFGNPMGNLYVTAEDDAVLRDPASRKGRAFSVDLTPGA